MKLREPGGVVVVNPPAPDAPVVSVASTAAAAKAPPEAQPSREALEQAIERANRQIASVAPSLEFEIDAHSHEVVIRLVDREDRSVLRQVPTPEMLAIARALERMQSMLVRVRA